MRIDVIKIPCVVIIGAFLYMIYAPFDYDGLFIADGVVLYREETAGRAACIGSEAGDSGDFSFSFRGVFQ